MQSSTDHSLGSPLRDIVLHRRDAGRCQAGPEAVSSAGGTAVPLP